MINSISTDSKWKLVLTDIVILVLVYFIPAITHLSPFPLYYLDPMRLLLFSGYLLSRNHTNAYIMALTIPLFSTLVIHHPPFYKALLISIELLVNIAGFHYLLTKVKWQPAILIFISIVFSKLIYYSCKYFFIQMALIEGPLKATDLDVQLAVATGISLLFAFFYKKSSLN